MEKRKLLLITILLCFVLSSFSCIALYGCDKGTVSQDKVVFCKADEEKGVNAYVQLPEKGKLKIALVTDPQPDTNLLHRECGADNEKTYTLIRKCLEKKQPDLVIIPGDMIISFSKDNIAPLTKFADFMDSFEIPWMPVIGNHDSELLYVSAGIQKDRDAVYELLSGYKYCLIGQNRVGKTLINYFVDVLDSKGKVIYSLGCLDMDDSKVTSDTPQLVNWYEEQISKQALANGGKTVPSMLFMHVPLSEVYTAWDERSEDTYFYGDLVEEGSKKGAGLLFPKIEALGSTKAVFFGHEHSNDCSISYHGIRLTYGQLTSFSDSYRFDYERKLPLSPSLKSCDWSMLSKYGDDRGLTVITIDENSEYEVTPYYASEMFEDYNEWNIDYDDVVAKQKERGTSVTGYNN